MNQVVLNGRLKITYPDGFRELQYTEKAGMQFTAEPPQFCISDPERHMIVSAAYRVINGLSAALLRTEEIAAKAEEQIRSAMTPYGYRPEGTVSLDNMTGFRYSYTAENTAMSGETLIMKEGRTVYYIHCWYRTALQEESIRIFHAMF